MMVNVSIDPGMTATGICVWLDGKPVSGHTLKPKGSNPQEKLTDLYYRLSSTVHDIREEYGVIGRVAIEDYVVWIPPKRANSLRKLFMVTAMIFTYFLAVHQLEAVHVCKGKVGKEQADILAKKYNFIGSEHARDALHIGYLAGFGKD